MIRLSRVARDARKQRSNCSSWASSLLKKSPRERPRAFCGEPRRAEQGPAKRGAGAPLGMRPWSWPWARHRWPVRASAVRSPNKFGAPLPRCDAPPALAGGCDPAADRARRDMRVSMRACTVGSPQAGRPARRSRGPIACDGDATRDGRMGPPAAVAAFAVRSPTSWGPSSALRRPLLRVPARTRATTA
jgi:hypothetical protein